MLPQVAADVHPRNRVNNVTHPPNKNSTDRATILDRRKQREAVRRAPRKKLKYHLGVIAMLRPADGKPEVNRKNTTIARGRRAEVTIAIEPISIAEAEETPKTHHPGAARKEVIALPELNAIVEPETIAELPEVSAIGAVIRGVGRRSVRRGKERLRRNAATRWIVVVVAEKWAWREESDRDMTK